jgi:hypothetical protein
MVLPLLLASSTLFLPGCGGGNNVKVYGKLLKGGAKYTPPEGHRVSITFVAIEAQDEAGKAIKNEPFQATLDQDGESFSLPGPDGYGVPPGKYRVAVTQRMTREAFESTKPKAPAGKPPITRETDFLDEKFSVDKSPIVREIKGGTNLVIDLDKPSES